MPAETRLFNYSLLVMGRHEPKGMAYSKQIFVMAKTVKIPSAEGQGTEILGDRVQQRLG